MEKFKDVLSYVLGYLQKIGKSLMLPVAVLPAAAILMGFGYWFAEVIDPEFVISVIFLGAGGAIIGNIPVLFAAGVSYGLCKKRDGAAALAGVVAYFVFVTLLSPGNVEGIRGVLTDEMDLAFGNIDNAFIGIISGVIGGHTFNRFGGVELPKALGFFSGRRLVAIVAAFIALIISMPMLFVWPVVFTGLTNFGVAMADLGAFGAGVYGFFNRLLIPLGLHHALNAVFWFEGFGIADLELFLAGEGEAGVTGRYMAGYFPIMMFGLPGAALAMVHTANKENKSKVASIMIAGAFASFFTGITEPIEFSFLFVAPLLFLVHAFFTGISMIIAAAIPAISGFGFSAGVIDMALQAANPLAVNWWLLPIIGVGFFFLYYFSFRYLIVRFDIPTPGRRGKMEDEDEETEEGEEKESKHKKKARKVLELLGGKENIADFDYCVTRLRLKLKDTSKLDREKLKNAGATDISVSGKNVQVIMGTDTQFIADAMEALIYRE